MNIQWFGQSCFKLQGDSTTVIIDPLSKTSGLKAPRLAGDIVLCTSKDEKIVAQDTVKPVTDDVFIIDQPGEYEVQNTFVYGVAGEDGSDSVLYRIEIDGLSIVHTGQLTTPLTNAQMEHLEGIDIVIVPAGGEPLTVKQAAEVISQLEPRIVIPMLYKIPGLKNGAPQDAAAFIKEIGVASETTDKYKITKKNLPQDEMKLIVVTA